MIATLALIACGILFCMALSFFFSGSETAVISVNRYRLRGLHEQGDPEAGRLLTLLANTQRLLVMTLIGTNIGNVLATLCFKLLLQNSLPNAEGIAFAFIRWSELLSIVLLAPTLIIFCEILPKALFRAHADRLFRTLRPVYVFCIYFFYPLIWLVEKSWSVILGPLTEARSRAMRRVTRQDVINLINPDEIKDEEEDEENEAEKDREKENGNEAEEKPGNAEPLPGVKNRLAPAAAGGALPPMEESDERQMVENILRLNQTRAEEIMTPLVDLVAVRLGQIDFEGLRRIAIDSGYSRIPVYKDRIVHIIGYLEIYRVMRENDGTQKIEDFIEHPHYVPETKRVDDLLQEFLELRIKNAVAIDEYGGCSGWISREDIIEEIVGELGDELDEPEQMIRKTGEGIYLIDGRAKIDAVNRELDADFSDEDWETIAGLVLTEMGRLPKAGNEVTIDGWRARVLAIEGRRISKIQLQRH